MEKKTTCERRRERKTAGRKSGRSGRKERRILWISSDSDGNGRRIETNTKEK